MRTFEIKGFWGFLFFTTTTLLILTAAVALPISFVWVGWNALVGELLKGPMIAFWQAAILAAIFVVLFKIIFCPEVSFHIKKIKNPEDLEAHLRKLNEQDSSKD